MLLTANYPDECLWEGPVKNHYMSGYTIYTVYEATEESCKNACELECSFHCLSFNFYKGYAQCDLSMRNTYTVALTESTSYDYYERNCDSECKHFKT